MKTLNTILFATLVGLIISNTAAAKDFKVVGQEFLPLQGTGDDGKMTGVHFEVAKRACEKIKWNCTFQIAPSARALELLKSGDAHIALGLAKTPDREAIASFPPMISQLGYTFFVKKGSAVKFTKADDFKGVTVGVHGGSATHKDLLEQNTKIGDSMKVVEETTAEIPSRKLAGGRYGNNSAIYCSRPVCMYQARKENLDIEPVSFDLKIQSHGILVSKTSVTDEEFQSFTKAVSEIMKTDEIKKIFAANDLAIHPENK